MPLARGVAVRGPLAVVLASMAASSLIAVLGAFLVVAASSGHGPAAPAAGGSLPGVELGDADALAEAVAGIVGVDPDAGPDGFYTVYLSGRLLVLRASDLGLVGADARRVGAVAYVDGEWVMLPVAVYDHVAGAGDYRVFLLDSDKMGPHTMVAVRLPTERPVYADIRADPPKVARGSTAIPVVLSARGYDEPVAVVYILADVKQGFPLRFTRYTLTPPSGLASHQKPLLSKLLLQEGGGKARADLALRLNALFVTQPLTPESGLAVVTIGPPTPVPDGGGGGTGSLLVDVRPVPSSKLVEPLSLAPGSGSVEVVVPVKPEDSPETLRWRRVLIDLTAVAVGGPAYAVDLTVRWQDEDVVLFDGLVLDGETITLAVDEYYESSAEAISLAIDYSGASVSWNVTLHNVRVYFTSIPSEYEPLISVLDEYRRLEDNYTVVGDSSRGFTIRLYVDEGRGRTALFIPLNPIDAGGVVLRDSAEGGVESALAGSWEYDVYVPAGLSSLLPAKLKFYIGTSLVCEDTIPQGMLHYTGTCSYRLESYSLEDFVSAPSLTVVFESEYDYAETDGVVELYFRVLDSAPLVMRKQAFAVYGDSYFTTSMVPSSSGIWTEDIFLVHSLIDNIYVGDVGLLHGHVGMAYASGSLQAQGVYTRNSLCISTSDLYKLDLYVIPSDPGAYDVYYDGAVYTYYLEDYTTRRVVVELEAGNGAGLEFYQARAGPKEAGELLERIDEVINVIGDVAGFVLRDPYAKVAHATITASKYLVGYIKTNLADAVEVEEPSDNELVVAIDVGLFSPSRDYFHLYLAFEAQYPGCGSYPLEARISYTLGSGGQEVPASPESTMEYVRYVGR